MCCNSVLFDRFKLQFCLITLVRSVLVNFVFVNMMSKNTKWRDCYVYFGEEDEKYFFYFLLIIFDFYLIKSLIYFCEISIDIIRRYSRIFFYEIFYDFFLGDILGFSIRRFFRIFFLKGKGLLKCNSES